METKIFYPGKRVHIKNTWCENSCEILEGKIMTIYSENDKDCAEVFVDGYGSICIDLDDIQGTRFLFGVGQDGLGAVTVCRVAQETPEAFVLTDGTMVKKGCGLMVNNHIRFFTDEEEAKTYQNSIQYNYRF